LGVATIANQLSKYNKSVRYVKNNYPTTPYYVCAGKKKKQNVTHVNWIWKTTFVPVNEQRNWNPKRKTLYSIIMVQDVNVLLLLKLRINNNNNNNNNNNHNEINTNNKEGGGGGQKTHCLANILEIAS